MNNLRIGKSDIYYYTLWDVETTTIDKERGVFSTRYTYYQNLSKDLIKKAKQKAFLKGCENLEINEDLNGKKSSFTVVTEPKKEFKEYEFTGGKYSGKDIRLCDDLNYLLWCIENNMYSKKYVF